MWSTKQVEIGRVQARLRHDADRVGLRLHLDNLLGSAAWQPPGVPPSAILVIRRLADPLPGQIAPHRSAVRASAAWERAMQKTIADLYRRAVRPEQGRVPAAGADAVLFADVAEMLACLALDLSQGRAWDRWWWRQGLRNLPFFSLEVLLCQQAHHLPAMLYHLAEWGQAVPVVEALSPMQIRSVLAALIQAQGLADVDVTGSARSPGQAQATEAAEAQGAEPVTEQPKRPPAPMQSRPRAPWDAWLSPGTVPHSLARESAFLLGLSLSLYHRPAAARSRSFFEAVRIWWNDRQMLPREAVGPEEIATTSPSLPRDHEQPRVAVSSAAEIAGDEAKMDVPSRPADLSDAAKPSERSQQTRLAGYGADRSSEREPGASTGGLDRQGSEPAERPGHEIEPQTVSDGRGGGHVKPDEPGPVNLGPGALEGVAEDSTPGETHPAQQERVLTKLGGVLYLINLMRHLDLPDCFEETCKLASQVGPWGVLELLGRGLLGEGSEHWESDPLWAVLAELDGREPGTLPGKGFVGRDGVCLPAAWLAQVALDRDDAWLWAANDESANPSLLGLNPHLARWLDLVLPYIRYRLQLALGGSEAEPLNLAQALLLVHGRLYVTSSHVDLVLRLDDMSLPIRLAGLDFDPGWLPDFGRVVQFHFE